MKSYTYKTELGLAEVQTASKNEEAFVELELELATSAIGYEYALQELEIVGDQGIESEQVKLKIDHLKNQYFIARKRLSEMDGIRLQDFETRLVHQKEAMFPKETYLH